MGDGDDFEWSYTSILLQEGENFYKARSDKRMMPLEKIDLSELEIDSRPIPNKHYRPPVSARLTVASTPTPDDCHEKLPQLILYNPRNKMGLSRRLLGEAEICEILAKHPHRNIATYRGCIVVGDRAAGLCFTKYHQTLLHRINHDNRAFDVQSCLQEVEKGLQHLHSLGWSTTRSTL